MKIAVGSKNPVKIKAVETAFKRFWTEVSVVGLEVDHGASIQPSSQKEAILGATKRAQLALEQAKADYGVGLEGNTFDSEQGMFLDGWVVIVNKHGEKGIANAGSLMMPEKIAKEVRKGKELGPVTDELFGHDNIKQKEGTVGMLTNNAITRTDAFEKGVIYALARFLNPKYYK